MEVFRLLVLLLSADASCSGFILKDGYVVTAAHCPKEGTANGKAYLAVRFNEEVDVMLVETNVKGKAKFADARLGEEVTVVGYGGGPAMLTKGHVSAIANGLLFLDITVFKGESGTAVYNKRGRIVGMVVSGVTDGHMTLTVAVPSKTIKEFLK